MASSAGSASTQEPVHTLRLRALRTSVHSSLHLRRASFHPPLQCPQGPLSSRGRASWLGKKGDSLGSQPLFHSLISAASATSHAQQHCGARGSSHSGTEKTHLYFCLFWTQNLSSSFVPRSSDSSVLTHSITGPKKKVRETQREISGTGLRGHTRSPHSLTGSPPSFRQTTCAHPSTCRKGLSGASLQC